MTGVAWKAIAAIIAVALLVAAILLFGYLGIREIHGMIDNAADTATAAADAKWIARLEKAEAEANKQIADQAKVTLQIQATASEQVRQAEQQLADREKQNEALPGGDKCGLSAGRVQLLPD
jgi:predicted PurR-regulated permease PerM